MSGWHLTDEIRNKWKPIIQDFIIKMQNLTAEQIEKMDNDEFFIPLSNTELAPSILQELLKELGYSDGDSDSNGWEMDFWINMQDNNHSYPSTCENLCIQGCGMTFELNLYVKEFM